ncbi:MAG: hypothetical protein SGCHY_005227 [Lobulomycetales sp.]
MWELLPFAVPWMIRYAVNSAVLVASFALAALYFYQKELIYPRYIPQDSRTHVLSPDEFQMKDFRDITLKTSDGVSLHAYHISHPNSDYTVLFLHANAGNMGHRLPIAQAFYRKFSCNILMLSYRGYGKSTGDPDESGMIVDADTALDYIKQDDILKKTRVVLYGQVYIQASYFQSIGAAVAISLAARRESEIQALIIENTFLSLHKLVPRILPAVGYILRIAPFFLYVHFPLLTSSFCSHQTWDSETRLSLVKHIPVCFLSGAKDELVPQSHMRALFQALQKSRLENGTSGACLQWSEFPKGGHNDTVMQLEYFDRVDEFWKKHVC